MEVSKDIERITPYEDEGYFFEITFEGDTDTTVFFVANQDLEQLRKMATNDEKTDQQFRNELQTLVEHTGLQNKQLPQSIVNTFRRNLTQNENWPEAASTPES